MFRKIFSAATAILLIFSMIAVSADSYFPNVAESDTKIEFEICNLSDIGTISAKEASFKLIIDSNNVKRIEVEYSVDGNNIKRIPFDITPGTTEKVFGIDIKNGIHNLNVNVYNDKTLIKSFDEKLYVADLYNRHFMDELSMRGINGNYLRGDKFKLGMDYLKNSGWRYARGTNTIWSQNELIKGVYNFKDEQDRVNAVLGVGMKLYGLFNQGNGFFYPAQPGVDSWSNDNTSLVWYLPQTKESLEGWANFAEATADFRRRYNYDVWEIWNEADLNSPAPSIFGRSQTYVDVAKAAAIRNLYNGDNIDYAMFTGTYDTDYYDYGLKAGLYPYASAISHHVYTSSGGDFGFAENRSYEYRINDIENVIVENGGWKDKAMSETGYTTPKAAKYPTTEEASWNIGKVYAMCELNDYEYCTVYNMIDPGTDAKFTEDNFGQITNDLKPKPSYLSTLAFNNFTEGGVIVGELDFGEDKVTRAIVYYIDGEPVVMAWTYSDDGKTLEWNPGGATFDVYDYMGNKVAQNTNTVSLSNAPVYLKGFSKEWIAKAVKFEVQKRSGDWLERYGDTVSSEIKSKFDSEIDSVYDDLKDLPDAECVQKHMNNLSDIASDIINQGKNGKYSEIDVSKTVYGIYRIIQRLDNLYIAVYDKETVENATDSAKRAQQKADKIYAKDMRIMQYSNEMLRHANKYAKKIALVKKMEDNPNKAGVIAGWNYMEEILCKWFDTFSEYESLTELGYQIQSPYYERNSYVNTDVTTNYNVWNYSKRTFAGTLNIYDDSGKLVAKSKSFQLNGDGGYKELAMKINTKKPESGAEQGFYDVCLVDLNGNIVSSQKTVYEVKDKFEVVSEACTQNVQELSSLPIKIKNVMDVPSKAHLKVESDDNFKFAQTEFDVDIDAKSSVTIDMPVSKIDETAYHMYSFKYEVSDEKGNVIVSSEELVNFTTIVKTDSKIDVQSFNGDISDWKDAYPIYLNTPNNPNDAESWKNAQCSSRFMLKWDKDALYLLGDIYDNFYLQEYQGSKIWQGDSVQFSFDPLNDGSLSVNNGMQTTYKPDDYELGFSFTANGNEYYAWQSPNALQGGVVDWVKIVRDNDKKNTRYLVKLDNSVLENISFSEGKTIGINLVVNDADILGRDNYYEFTPGTAGTKDPSQYADFILSGVKPKNMTDGRAADVFPITVKNTFK